MCVDIQTVHYMLIFSLTDFLTQNKCKKKKRIIRFNSSDSEPAESAPPKKRARIQSSDSEDMDSQTTVSYSQTFDSQATVEYNVDSQETIPPSQERKDKIKFLSEAYPEKSRKVSSTISFFLTS